MAEMQAVVCHGPTDYRLEHVPRPQPGPNELLIAIEARGICASDCKCHSGAAMFWGGNGKPAWVKTPVIPGHEYIGRLLTSRGIVSHRFALGEWEPAFALANSLDSIKVLLVPEHE